jgi:hypothetical protein
MVLEIELGGEFGKGGFFVVSEIKKITLNHNDADDEEEEMRPKHDKRDDEDYIQSVVQNRKFMQKHSLRNGNDCRYALKTMQDSCRKDPSMYVNTLVDLAIEAKFLSSVRHPNIIKMRAVSTGPGGDLCHSNAFLVLDRLYDMLTDRIDQWNKKSQNGLAKLFDFQRKRENAFLATRLAVAYDIASAMSYLHELK